MMDGIKTSCGNIIPPIPPDTNPYTGRSFDLDFTIWVKGGEDYAVPLLSMNGSVLRQKEYFLDGFQISAVSFKNLGKQDYMSVSEGGSKPYTIECPKVKGVIELRELEWSFDRVMTCSNNTDPNTKPEWKEFKQFKEISFFEFIKPFDWINIPGVW